MTVLDDPFDVPRGVKLAFLHRCGSAYPTYGFIYGRPAEDGVRPAHPSALLTGVDPDIIGSVIDAIR